MTEAIDTASATDRIAIFDTLYTASEDPWSTAERWYEERRRSLILASLPRRRYGRAYEAGCGNGNLSALLAPRCDDLFASDGSEAAVRIARKGLAAFPSVRVELHRLPEDWPDARFDLIVLSELLYFLKDDEVERIAKLAIRSAGETGLIVAAHWRAEIEGFGHRGDETHALFERALALPSLFTYADDDFVLSGWSADTRSVAMREGVRLKA